MGVRRERPRCSKEMKWNESGQGERGEGDLLWLHPSGSESDGLTVVSSPNTHACLLFSRLSAASSFSLSCGLCPQISCLFLMPLTASISNFRLGSQSHLSLFYQMPSSADGFKSSALLFLNSMHIFLIYLLLFISSLLMKRSWNGRDAYLKDLLQKKKKKWRQYFLFTVCITGYSCGLYFCCTISRMSLGLAFLTCIQCASSFHWNPLGRFQPDMGPGILFILSYKMLQVKFNLSFIF